MSMDRLDALTVHDLRVVTTLAEVLHFGSTAEALGVTQPTVSASVTKFESLVGSKVFYRTSRRCEVTPIGEQLLEFANAALAQIDQIAGSRDSGEFAGTLRLGLIPTMAPYVMPHLADPARRSFPRLSIYFTEAFTERVLEEVLSHHLDVGIVSTFQGRKGIDAHLLFREPLVLALNRSHPFALLDEVPLESLSPANALLLDKGNCLRDQTLGLCGSAADGERPAHSTSLTTLLYLVSAGFGYAVIPQMAAKAAQDVWQVEIRPLTPPTNREVLLVHRSGDSRRNYYLELMSLVRKELGPSGSARC
jgi:LysR family transcriptional regulator, hydrogen peroxide-inducible genes activator